MSCAVGVTDLRWHSQLLRDQPTGEANFWTPTPWKTRLPTGTRFGFLLKAPVRKLGGFGHFVEYVEHTVTDAWNRWGLANGVESRSELYARVVEFAAKRSVTPITSDEPVIGCIVLRDCVLLDADEQFSPEDVGLEFPRQIVKWKRFSQELSIPLQLGPADFAEPFVIGGPTSEDWVLTAKRKRVAQPIFRREVLAAYGGKCALTAFDCGEGLEAAHIEPFRGPHSNHPQNGIAMRRDIHRLFDAGLLTFESSGDVHLSEQVLATAYVILSGARAKWPEDGNLRPSPEALAYHRLNIFRGKLS